MQINPNNESHILVFKNWRYALDVLVKKWSLVKIEDGKITLGPLLFEDRKQCELYIQGVEKCPMI